MSNPNPMGNGITRVLKTLLYGIPVSLLVCLGIWIVSIGKGGSLAGVASSILVFAGRGVGDILFTPWTLLLVSVIVLVVRPNTFDPAVKWLGAIFEQIGGFKFRDPDPEPPVDINAVASTALHRPSQEGKPNRSDTLFFKKLLTRTSSTVICRFLLYAIDRPGRPKDFSLEQLVAWTFGTQSMHLLKKQGTIDTVLLPASLLVQTGAIEGALDMGKDGNNFTSIAVSPAAHQALEELARDGYQMTPQVEIT